MSKNYNNYFKENYNRENKVEETELAPVLEETETDSTVKEPVVETTPEPAPVYKISDCKRLNVRKIPSVHGEVIRVLEENEEFTIKEVENRPEWVKVSINNVSGYCMKKYIRIK